MPRTDIHRPGSIEFDPENYDLLGVFDLHPEHGDGPHRVRVVQGQLVQGRTFNGAPHGSGQCSHCGAHLRYAALMVHTPTNILMWVGETCLDSRFSLTKAEFRRAREAGRARAEAHAKQARIAELCEQHPLLTWLTYPQATDNPFLLDVGRKLQQYGDLSARQIDAVERAIVRDTGRADTRAAEEASASPVPEGKQVIVGRIVSIRNDPNPFNWYGEITRMLVVSDDGWKVWGTMPAALGRADVADIRKARVEFVATVTRSDDDKTFGFFSRPSKARVLADQDA